MIDIETLQNIDPSVFEQMQPVVQQVVSRYGRGRNLTEADIDQMANEVVAGSQSHFHMPAGYTHSTLNDIARFLILISLYNTYGYNLDPFWLLYFGGIPSFLIPYLIFGLPPFYRIPWRPPFWGGPIFRPPHPPRPPRPPSGGRPPRPPSDGGSSRPLRR